MQGNNKWVLLRAFSNNLEANVVCSFLNSQGIETQSKDEHIVNINWLYSNAVGGVKVMVHEGDFKKAVELLENQENRSHLEVVGIECPNCQSRETEIQVTSRHGLAAIFVALFSVVIPLSHKEKWKCESCQHVWEEKELTSPVFAFFNWLIFLFLVALFGSLIFSSVQAFL